MCCFFGLVTAATLYKFSYRYFHYSIAHINKYISWMSILGPYQVKNWGNLSRENLVNLMDTIRFKRQINNNSSSSSQRSGATVINTPCWSLNDWAKSILTIMACLMLLGQPHYSPIIWQAGLTLVSSLLADRDNHQKQVHYLNIHFGWLAGWINQFT